VLDPAPVLKPRVGDRHVLDRGDRGFLGKVADRVDPHRQPGLDTPAIHQWLLKHPRFHLHFTPTSSSWMNLVERWLAELTNRRLRRSAHRSVTDLETDIRKWINEWNKNPKPFVWTKTADEILEALAAYCQRVTGPGR
jgi:hypothetical protein